MSSTASLQHLSPSDLASAAVANVVLLIEHLRFGWEQASTFLRIDHLRIEAGETVLLSGPSGCGKSTLIGLIGGLLQPNSGRLRIDGETPADLASHRRDRFRAEHIGIIFQQFNLLPYLSLLDNVLLPLRFAPRRRARAGDNSMQRRASAEGLLSDLGLARDHWRKPVFQLSVGQQQRAAVARALIGEPPLILADEPTSALDTRNRDLFLSLLLEQARRCRSAVLLVSHDPHLSTQVDRHLSFEDWQQQVLGA